MAIRTVKRELEAKLTAKSGGLFSKPTGKLERKSYEDFGERLKVTVRNLKVPDQSTAIVTVDGTEIVQIVISDGAGRYDHESRDSTVFPALEAGQVVQVHVNGTLVLSGELKVD